MAIKEVSLRDTHIKKIKKLKKYIFRSNYEYAIGGCVCLKKQMLQAMYYYAIDFYNRYGKPMEVNSIAGSSHSTNSWHYQVCIILGKMIDVPKCIVDFVENNQIL